MAGLVYAEVPVTKCRQSSMYMTPDGRIVGPLPCDLQGRATYEGRGFRMVSGENLVATMGSHPISETLAENESLKARIAELEGQIEGSIAELEGQLEASAEEYLECKECGFAAATDKGLADHMAEDHKEE